MTAAHVAEMSNFFKNAVCNFEMYDHWTMIWGKGEFLLGPQGQFGGIDKEESKRGKDVT